MDRNVEEQLFDSFLEAAGRTSSGMQVTEELARNLTDPRTNAVSMTEALSNASTPEPPGATAFGASASYVGSSAHSEPIGTSDGGGVSVGSMASTFLEGGLGIVPLITGLMGLFSGESGQPPPLAKYEMPSSIAFTSAESGRGLSAADFDQMGAPRVLGGAGDILAGADYTGGNSNGVAGSGVSGTASSAASTPITVNVQTMDARSFLDNSDQIAQAVRGEMLNLSSINDMVNEL